MPSTYCTPLAIDRFTLRVKSELLLGESALGGAQRDLDLGDRADLRRELLVSRRSVRRDGEGLLIVER